MSSHSLARKMFSLILLGLLPVSAFAASSKHISETLDSSGLEGVKLEISVAELDIEVWEGDEIQLEIDIESNRNWLSWRRKDVAEIELEMDVNGSRAYLSLTEDNIDQDWRVRLPAHLALEVEMGVGDMRIEGLDNDLEVELGVGAVRVEMAADDVASINATAGVGDASIEGFRNRADNEQRFISADAYYVGAGEHDIHVDVGVGDVRVRAN